MEHRYDYDFIIVGSGFGGSVSALRLAEKGYRVAVLEAGKRWRQEDFPVSNWKVWKWLWSPQLKLQGIMKLIFFRHLTIAAGVGVGGGSLVYANTLLVPPKVVFDDPQWGQGEGWYERMAPHYQTAKTMLGVNETPAIFASDELLKNYAAEIGRSAHFKKTDVGIYFGEPGKTVPDPYFAGKGPDRTGCTFCGGCMTGCRDGAKNTLDRNYLYLAEQLGVTIFPETQVEGVYPLSVDGSAGYELKVKRSTRWFGRSRCLRARSVILSGGVLGTLPLLMQGRDEGHFAHLSDQLGEIVRTNSEAIVGASAVDDEVDYSHGIAIASSLFVDDTTHIEMVRYRKESGAIGLLTTVQVDGEGDVPRIVRFLTTVLRHPIVFLRSMIPYHFASRGVIILVMQTIDNHLRLKWRRLFGIGPLHLATEIPEGQKIPTFIPQGNAAAKRFGEMMGGFARSSFPEVLMDAPATAHILGGARIGPDPQHGVIDPQNRVFGYQNLWVIDGSMVPVNLGVNPSLTITALAEHAMSHIPEKKQ